MSRSKLMDRTGAALLAATLVLAAGPAMACAFHGDGPHQRMIGGMGSMRGAFGIFVPPGPTAPVMTSAPPTLTIDDARSQFLARYKVKIEAVDDRSSPPSRQP